MQVLITTRVRRPGISARRLRAAVLHTLRRERCPMRTEVSVVLVGDPTIRRLNHRYRRTNKVTDVLAFPTHAEVEGRWVLGDVILSVDRARAQAREVGHLVRTEVALLAVHGILHLVGYNDQTRAQAAVMARRQRQILAELGEEVRG